MGTELLHHAGDHHQQHKGSTHSSRISAYNSATHLLPSSLCVRGWAGAFRSLLLRLSTGMEGEGVLVISEGSCQDLVRNLKEQYLKNN